MIRPKKYAVYYHEIPLLLELFIKKDGNMGVTKDGVHKGLGHACPRLTITVNPGAIDTDRERLRRLEELLTELSANNQIAGWS